MDFDKIDIDPHKSILLLANHYSWWDGFILYSLNKRLFKKKFHVMALEETLQKVPFLGYIGAFSVKKESREMVTSLEYAVSLLNEPDNLVLIFPQGRLYSNFIEKVSFQKGALHIISKVKGKCNLVYAVSFTEGFQHKKPTLHIHLESHSADNGVQNLEGSYHDFYQSARTKQTAKIF